MSTGGAFNLLVAVASVLCLLGALLAYQGLRKRRRGDELRCGRCEYELQGIASKQCPECGIAFTAATIARGTPYRKHGLAIAGTLTLLLGVGTLGSVVSGAFSNTDWYAYRPTTWVIDDLSRPTPGERQRAWIELGRRIGTSRLTQEHADRLARAAIPMLSATTSFSAREAWDELMRQDAAGTLSTVSRARLIEFCLQQQAAPSPITDWQKLLNWAADQFLAGKFTDEQREAFFTNLFKVDLAARAVVARGDGLPYLIRLNGRGPSGKLWYRQTRGELLIDDHKMPPHGFASSGSGFSGSSTGSWLKLPPDLTPGRHTLRVVNNVDIYEGKVPPGSETESTPLWKRDIALTTTFELVDVVPPNLLQEVDDPSLRPTIRKAIHASDVTTQSGDRRGLSLSLNFRNVPIDVAFDVFIVVDDKEHRIGSVTARAAPNSSSGSHLHGGDFDPGNLSAVRIRLRSNEAVARQTVDLTRIWKGEITLDEVPVIQKNQPNGR